MASRSLLGLVNKYPIFLALCLGLGSWTISPAKGDDPKDYLIQKVCVDAKGKVLLADPYDPPAGSHLRNLRVGEPFPYYKHGQPFPSHPDGIIRHDSYPVLDKKGNELALNPFYFGENSPSNGYDLYGLGAGWSWVASTQDGGGFSTTFFGADKGKAVPYNGWLFFPTRWVTGNFAPPQGGQIKWPIQGRYWEQQGEPWPGKTPPDYVHEFASETDWRLIKNCSFGGMGGSPEKKLDAILSVHGYVSKDQPDHHLFMTEGHLEIFYFCKLYGAVRWEVWTPIERLGDYNKPSSLRKKALLAARNEGQPIPEAGQSYVQPTDLPATPENRFIVTEFAGGDGIKSLYAATSIQDWSAVTVLPSLQFPPPCPIPQQNLLTNFHFDEGTLAPWRSTGAGTSPTSWKLMQSKTALDTKYVKKGEEGGVRYLSLHCPGAPASGQQLYQDIPVKGLRSGAYEATLRVHSESGEGSMKMLLQQVDADGKILSTDLTVTKPIEPKNFRHDYTGVNDSSPGASVVMSSMMMAGRGQVTIQPGTAFLRFSVQPQTPGNFDLLDANVSIQTPPAS